MKGSESKCKSCNETKGTHQRHSPPPPPSPHLRPAGKEQPLVPAQPRQPPAVVTTHHSLGELTRHLSLAYTPFETVYGFPRPEKGFCTSSQMAGCIVSMVQTSNSQVLPVAGVPPHPHRQLCRCAIGCIAQAPWNSACSLHKNTGCGPKRWCGLTWGAATASLLTAVSNRRACSLARSRSSSVCSLFTCAEGLHKCQFCVEGV